MIRDLEVLVVRKAIKNLHLAVYPPDGQVRVAVPLHIDDEQVRLAVISRLGWIRKQRADFATQPRQSTREMVSGESHYLFGTRYRLEVIWRRGRHEVIIENRTTLRLLVNPGTTRAKRTLVLNEWYRGILKEAIPDLLAHWQPIIGVEVSGWGIQKMKTKWGSCNIEPRRILLNLELAKKPVECLEYIVVHELVHLHERHHNERFRTLMNKYMPQWRLYRDILKSEPLGHNDWRY